MIFSLKKYKTNLVYYTHMGNKKSNSPPMVEVKSRNYFKNLDE